MAGEPTAGARGLGCANFSKPAKISILPKDICIVSIHENSANLAKYKTPFVNVEMECLYIETAAI